MAKYKLVSTPMIYMPTMVELLRHDFRLGFMTREDCFAKFRPVWDEKDVPDVVIEKLVDGEYTVDDKTVVVEVQNEPNNSSSDR